MSAFLSWLDTLPRTRVGTAGLDWPAYRAMGVAGFYGALAVTLASGLLMQRSLLVLAGLCAVCALSFFTYAGACRRISGEERIVLLEHVWFALALGALFLLGLGEPVLPYLDLAIPGLCVFLAAGRIGCLLVGCCHGRPSSFGLIYPERHTEDGFPRHLAGIRLFPLPAFEALGLAAIGTAGFAFLAWAPAGDALAWFLIAYAVLRFGLEGLRGDPRPQLLGLSVARWMCVVQFAAVLWWGSRTHGRGVERAWIVGLLGLMFAAGLVWKNRTGLERTLLAPGHIREIAGFFRTQLESTHTLPDVPVASVTSRGVSMAVSEAGDADWAHVSLGLPAGRFNLPLLCELAARTLGQIDIDGARYGNGRILHVPVLARNTGSPQVSGLQLYAGLVRSMQRDFHSPARQEPEVFQEAVPRGNCPWYFIPDGRDG